MCHNLKSTLYEDSQRLEEMSLNIHMSQVNVDKQYFLFTGVYHFLNTEESGGMVCKVGINFELEGVNRWRTSQISALTLQEA